MKKIILFIFVLLIAITGIGQTKKGKIFLKNGSVIKGKITELENSGTIQIQSAGNLWVFNNNEIEKIDYSYNKAQKQTLDRQSKISNHTQVGILIGNSQNSQSAPFSFHSSLNYKAGNGISAGNDCGSTVNRLDVLELSENYTDNKLISSYPLVGPYGLGIDGQTLFVCDGDAGLKIYDVTDKLNIDDNMIAQFAQINTYDVIPVNGNLFLIGDDGFYQYDYSDLQNIQLLSFIEVKR